jgi:hypothetical protein
VRLLKYFRYDHLKDDTLKNVSQKFSELTQELETLNATGLFKDQDELDVCLRKLLEAKDCAVRAAL